MNPTNKTLDEYINMHLQKSDHERMLSEDFKKSCSLYEHAKETIIVMNHSGFTYQQMRDELNSDNYLDMMYNHLAKLLWVVDQWELFFNKTGSRFSK